MNSQYSIFDPLIMDCSESIIQSIYAGSIPSSESWGTPSLDGIQSIGPLAIESTESWGIPIVELGTW